VRSRRAELCRDFERNYKDDPYGEENGGATSKPGDAGGVLRPQPRPVCHGGNVSKCDPQQCEFRASCFRNAPTIREPRTPAQMQKIRIVTITVLPTAKLFW
jgi:hypothetical protein